MSGYRNTAFKALYRDPLHNQGSSYTMAGNTESLPSTDQVALTSKEVAERWSPARAELASVSNNSDSGALEERLPLHLLTDIADSDVDAGEWVQSCLDEIQALVGVERVFFFDAKGSCANSPDGRDDSAAEVGSCVHSSDFDREAIANPESKVPMALLNRALELNHAIWALDTLQDGQDLNIPPEIVSQTRGFAIVPVVMRGQCFGILHLEHRFQPIQVDRGAVNGLILRLRSFALRWAIERVETENCTLWADAIKLRKQVKASKGAARATPGIVVKKSAEAQQSLIGDYSMIIGSSAGMMEIFRLLDRIRTSTAPVLINGDSGTGKELIANAIHANSPRNKMNFVSENCAALTETLLESELFGYVKGAFTGATRDHKGLFELAHGGTLFLDEVGDMSSNMQKKLLRAVQEGVVRRVGGKEYISVDVRIISATNKDLLQEVRSGEFREDLYYRLNVINIKLPPLRDRREDIPELVESFLGDLARSSGVDKAIDPAAMQLLVQHAWPGNIRELQNEVKRLFALSDGTVELANVSEGIRKGNGRLSLNALEDDLQSLTLKDAVEKVERALIKRALLEAQGNKSQVAKQLQIPKTSLYNKISKYSLDEEVQELLY
jgi:DNA-binding NtrC family response regulator